jgi:type I restriction enzyme S subunit
MRDPSTWSSLRLGEIISLEYGRALPTEIRTGEGYPVVGSSGLSGRHRKALIDGPGVIVGRKGTVGSIIWCDEPSWPIDTTYWVKPHDELNLRWLYWKLKTLGLERMYSSTGVPGLSREEAYEVRVHLPPQQQQQRIAEILDTLDDQTSASEAWIAKAKGLRIEMFLRMMQCGIADDGSVRDPKCHPKEFQESPVGLIPRAWRVKPIGQLLADVDPAMRSGPFGSALLKGELRDLGIPLLGIDNVEVEHFVDAYSRFVDEAKFRELKRYAVRSGDVMVTIMGTVGRCCVAPENVGKALSSKHTWTISLDREQYRPMLACMQINYSPLVISHFRRDTQGGIMSAIRSETLRTTPLPVPPLMEQLEIEKRLEAWTHRIGVEEGRISKLLLLKKGLLEDLLSGRVMVSVGDD